MEEKRRKLNLKSKFYTCFITCFEEQLPEGKAALLDAIKTEDPKQYQIIGIKHDKSLTNKPHYHITVRMNSRDKRGVMSTLLKQLHVQFRPGLDDALINGKKPALETCGSFERSVTYLLHATTEAIQNGKIRYEKDDLVTNLPNADLDKVLSGYLPSKKALTKKTMSNLIDRIRIAGENLESFDEVVASFNILGFTPSEEAKLIKTYLSAAEERFRRDDHIPRLTLEIEYPENTTNDQIKHIDKAILSAFKGYRTLSTDSFISNCSFNPLTEAIIFFNYYDGKDNDILFDLSQLQRIYLSKPFISKNNMPWMGRYFVFTHRYNPRMRTIPKYTIKEVIVPSDLYPNGEKKKIREEHNITENIEFKECPNSFLCTISNGKIECIKPPAFKVSQEEYNYFISEFKKNRDAINKELEKPVEKYTLIDITDLND